MNHPTADTSTNQPIDSSLVGTTPEESEIPYAADSPVIQDLAAALLQQFGRSGCGVLSAGVGNR